MERQDGIPATTVYGIPDTRGRLPLPSLDPFQVLQERVDLQWTPMSRPLSFELKVYPLRVRGGAL
ncbi:MAG: hypothetical protein P1S59_10235, partial [bacterium]|nr:hypothetical protein [bacterium]